MYRKIVYIAICCLFLAHANAQKEKVSQLLNKIKLDVAPILNDSTLTPACKKNINDLKKELPSNNPNALTVLKIQFLLNTSKRLIAFGNSEAGKACRDLRVDSLLANTNELVKELKNIQQFQKDSLIKITVAVIDSITRTGVDSKLTVDSLGKPITRFEASSDSAGYYDLSLVPNRHYVINVKADKYFPYVKEFAPKKSGENLVIFLQPVAAAKTGVDSPAGIKNIAVAPVAGAQRPQRENKVVLYGMFFLLVILLFFSVLYFNVLWKSVKTAREKKLGILFNPARVFQNEINQKDAYIHEIHRNLEVVESSFAQLTQKQQAMDLEPKTTAPVEIAATGTAETKVADKDELKEAEPAETKETLPAPVKETTARYFLCEIMMTAGPRKKFMNEPNADKDLGEDVCGFIATADEVLIWLLDGTSDTHCLINPATKREYFSSRLQAQSIAEKLRKHFGEKPSAPLNNIMQQAIQSVRLDWLKAIGELPEEEKQRLKTNIDNQNFPECSCTVLLSRLLINGDFTGYRSGDSKILLFNTKAKKGINFVETALATKNPLSNDRTFFRMQFDENENFDILCNEPIFEIITEKDISLVISYSDGIGADTEQALTEMYENAPDKIRQEIISHIQGTADDKAICFLGIMQKA